jgi:hypothetical protein
MAPISAGYPLPGAVTFKLPAQRSARSAFSRCRRRPLAHHCQESALGFDGGSRPPPFCGVHARREIWRHDTARPCSSGLAACSVPVLRNETTRARTSPGNRRPLPRRPGDGPWSTPPASRTDGSSRRCAAGGRALGTADHRGLLGFSALDGDEQSERACPHEVAQTAVRVRIREPTRSARRASLRQRTPCSEDPFKLTRRGRSGGSPRTTALRRYVQN